MSVYHPQAALALKIIWDTFERDDSKAEVSDELFLLARDVTVDKTNWNEADSFTADVDYKSFPFDPRTIRTVQVRIYMEDTGALFNRDGTPREIVPDRVNAENLVFAGFVDTMDVSYTGEDRQVHMEGRDFTGLFLDVSTPALRELIKPNYTMKRVVDTVIKSSKTTENMKSEVDPESHGAVFAPLSRAGFDLSNAEARKNFPRGSNNWEVIQIFAAQAGVIVYVEGDVVKLREAKNIYEEKRAALMVYGHNLNSVTFGRKLGRQKDFNVRVFSTDVEGKLQLSVEIPKKARDPEFIRKFVTKPGQHNTILEVDTLGKKVEPPRAAPFLYFPIPNVKSKATLTRIGESIFETIARQQLEGHLETNEMLFVQRSAEIIKNQPINFGEAVDQRSDRAIPFKDIGMGSYISVLIDDEDLKRIGTFSDLGDRTRYLLSRGYPIEIAKIFARRLTQLTNAFVIKSLRYSIREGEGFTLSAEFINIIDTKNAALGG